MDSDQSRDLETIQSIDSVYDQRLTARHRGDRGRRSYDAVRLTLTIGRATLRRIMRLSRGRPEAVRSFMRSAIAHELARRTALLRSGEAGGSREPGHRLDLSI
jgi:hypothetical protein